MSPRKKMVKKKPIKKNKKTIKKIKKISKKSELKSEKKTTATKKAKSSSKKIIEVKSLLAHNGATKIYSIKSDDENTCLMVFTNNLTDNNGDKKHVIADKNTYNCFIATRLFQYLEKYNVPHCFIKENDEHSVLVQKTETLPIKIAIRNIASQSLAKRLGIKEGTILERPVLEYYFSSDKVQSSFVNQYHLFALGVLNKEELDEISNLSFKINAVIRPFLSRRGIAIYDLQLSIGKINDTFVLADAITIDNCTLKINNLDLYFDRESNSINGKNVSKIMENIVELLKN